MDKVRVGVIGAGWWVTTNHLPILSKRDDVELVALCRLGEELLHKIKGEFGIPYATEDYRDLLEQDLDAVIVGTPHFLHYEHALAALKKGFHVLCEKPMALDAAEAWELVETAQTNNLHLLIPYGWHYKPFIQKAKQLMQDNILGEIEFVQCNMASPTKDFFGGAGTVPSQWEPSLAEPDPATWQVKEKGGGYGHGQITHSSALMFWLTGLRAREVTCRMTSPNSGVDMYNTATVVFDGGTIGTISGAATLPNDDKFQVDIRIFGTDGVMLLDVERERLVVRRHDEQHIQVDVSAGEGGYSCETPPELLIDLVKGYGRNDSPGEVAARSVELIAAMYQSAENGGVPTAVFRR